MDKSAYLGFTLIELSMVLVIIGLVVGGVLTGKDLIDTAAQRAQISQIEKFSTAIHTFQSKYGYLPGDIPDPQASQFGFQFRGFYTGEGDGNGIIEGVNGNAQGWNYGLYQIVGETPMAWVDLSTAGLIEGSFSGASSNNNPGMNITGSALNNWFPTAKLGKGNYVYIFSSFSSSNGALLGSADNFFGVSAVTMNNNGGGFYSSTAIPVQWAYNMDKKTDDGLPQSGRVRATYINYNISTNVNWAAGGGIAGANSGTAASGSPTTCFDNNGVAANPMQYSLNQNGGNGLNCALSFRFQ